MGRPNIATYADRVHLVMNLDLFLERHGPKPIVEALVESIDTIDIRAVSMNMTAAKAKYEETVQYLQNEINCLRDEKARLVKENTSFRAAAKEAVENARKALRVDPTVDEDFDD